MAGKPAVPPASGAAESGPGERLGPLQIERLAKADGRALIVYSHAEPREPDERATPREPRERATPREPDEPDEPDAR